MNFHFGPRPASALFALAVVAGSLFAVGSPAQGHAIIELNGKDAIAGTTSPMTLEVQHGCIDGAQGTLQVQAFTGKPWGSVIPKPVTGWSSAITKQSKGGSLITWIKQGAPAPFDTPLYFPLVVSWPKKSGIYGMSVLQICPSTSTLWNEPFTPATANKPSPPLTPLAQVQVKVS
jgi:hypothetical protein